MSGYLREIGQDLFKLGVLALGPLILVVAGLVVAAVIEIHQRIDQVRVIRAAYGLDRCCCEPARPAQGGTR